MKPPSHSSILIVGLARNVESIIESEIENLQNAFSDFSNFQFLILESDSDDRTVEVLTRICRVNSRIRFESLGHLRSDIPNRIERISFCRTKAQETAKKLIEEFDYVAVADLDGVNSLINKESVNSCWGEVNWDVCSANQEQNYYDIYALRHKSLAPNDCWLEYLESRRLGVHPMKALTQSVFSRQLHIPMESEWIEVDSAFGGLAIYTSRSESGEVVCEHVPFNKSIKSKGMKLFINPRLINSEGIDKGSLNYRFTYAIKYVVSVLSPSLFDRKFIR
jgi:hypothetical protein